MRCSPALRPCPNFWTPKRVGEYLLRLHDIYGILISGWSATPLGKDQVGMPLNDLPSREPGWTDLVCAYWDVMHALQRLPARQRDAVYLRYHEDLSFLEIAERMDLSERSHSPERLVKDGSRNLSRHLVRNGRRLRL